jgi:hypothetical protein
MPKIEGQKKLIPEAFKNKKFEGLIKVLEGSPSRATLEVLGMEITFGWVNIKGKKEFIEISRVREGRQSKGSMDIPKGLYMFAKDTAREVTKSHAETARNKANKQQLENRIKKQQPDLF